jgi:hypothetical protein
MLYLLRLVFVVVRRSFHPRSDLLLEKPCSLAAACRVERDGVRKARLTATEMAWVMCCDDSGRGGDDHTLHRSYFHAFMASIFSPVSHSLVELQPYA